MKGGKGEKEEGRRKGRGEREKEKGYRERLFLQRTKERGET